MAIFRRHPSRTGTGVEHNLKRLAADRDWSIVILRLGEVAQRNRCAPLELQVDGLRGLRIPKASQTSTLALRMVFHLRPLEGYPKPRASAGGDNNGQPNEQRLHHCQRQPALQSLDQAKKAMYCLINYVSTNYYLHDEMQREIRKQTLMLKANCTSTLKNDGTITMYARKKLSFTLFSEY